MGFYIAWLTLACLLIFIGMLLLSINITESEVEDVIKKDKEVEEKPPESFTDDNGVFWRLTRYSQEELKPYYKDKTLHILFESFQQQFKPYGCYYRIVVQKVSEPVVSFVETVRLNPSRFKVFNSRDISEWSHKTVDSITDKKTNQVFSRTSVYGCVSKQHEVLYTDNLIWLDSYERSWAEMEIKKIYAERKKRYEELVKDRKRRSLMKMYYTPNTKYEERTDDN